MAAAPSPLVVALFAWSLLSVCGGWPGVELASATSGATIGLYTRLAADVTVPTPDGNGGARGGSKSELADSTAVLLRQPAVPKQAASSWAAGNLLNKGAVVILALPLHLDEPCNVVVISDGRFYPGVGSVAAVRLELNGTSIGTSQVISWEKDVAQTPVQHSFSLAGAPASPLPPGTYVFHLVAEALNGVPFHVGADSGLGVIGFPSSGDVTVSSAVLGADSPVITPAGGNWNNHSAPYELQLTPVVRAQVQLAAEANPTLAAVSSGRSYLAGKQGDAMWVITLDGNRVVNNTDASHSDNDMCTCAEAGNAPMMSQAMYADVAPGTHFITLDATKEPWGAPLPPNPVSYRVGAGSGVVVVAGAPVTGRGVLSTATNKPLDYICVASSQAWRGCPPAGKPFVLVSATATVPNGHSGVVAFFAKTLVQADGHDKGGVVSLQIRIDGQPVGSVGVQQVQYPSAVSTRTVSASYVSGGRAALSPGPHTVEVVVTTSPGADFIHLAATRSLPLMWFG